MRRKKRKTTPQQAFAFFVMIAGLGALIFQIDPLDNTLHGVRLFFIGCAPGAVIGGLVSHRFHDQPRFRTVPSRERLAVILVVILGFGFESAAIASYWNVHGEQGPSEEVPLPVLDKGIGGKRRDSHYVHVRWRDQNSRLKVRETLYHKVSIGQELLVRVSPGALGYPHVTAFLGVRPAA